MKGMTVFAASLTLALCLTLSASGASVKSIPVGNLPTFVAVNETTNRIYVSNLTDSTVSVIDGGSDTVVATVPVGFLAEVVDVNSITNTIYVANLLDNSVSVIDGGTNTVTATITGLSSPFGVAVDALTNQIFVSNQGNNTVYVIDGATNTILSKVTVGSFPSGVRANSTANLIYVANEFSGTVSVIDGGSDTVANTFTLPQGAEPFFVALDPVTNRLFVTSPENAAVYVLDASSGALLQTISGGKVPFKSPTVAAMFQPGKTFLVSDSSSLNAVVEFSEITYGAVGGLKSGNKPGGIGVNRKTGKIYVAENGSNSVNVYSGFGGASPAAAHPHAQN